MKIKYPTSNKINIVNKFFKEKGLENFINEFQKPEKKVNQMEQVNPFKPNLVDLYRLYNFILLNKRITILEFGSGWSALVITLALNELKKKYNKKIQKLRRNNPFELFVLENEKKYLNITKKRINNFFKKNKKKNNIKIHYHLSDVEMTEHEGRIATKYKTIPLCNPDFIYLDGPHQFMVKGSVNGVSTRHKDMMPMVSDIIKFENFYTPGTILLIDGRSSNAIFFRNFFRRNWTYRHDKKNDQHIFLLNDPVLGKYNKLQIDFYKE